MADRLQAGYTEAQFAADAQAVRDSRWPHRASAGMAFARVFEQTRLAGLSREAVIRLLGPADGDLCFREVTSPPGSAALVDREPRLARPADGRLVYRLGDGHNHGPIYTVRLERDRVSAVEISAGY
jgi:hypothetical protein